jgi:MerR family transcriptional regulator, copper efflux regulator
MDGFTIGNVAKRAQVRVETLRYYERRGLMARPARSASNYRLYPADAAGRVRFIKRAQQLGFSLTEIRELLSLRAARRSRCADVRARATAKIADASSGGSSCFTVPKATSINESSPTRTAPCACCAARA